MLTQHKIIWKEMAKIFNNYKKNFQINKKRITQIQMKNLNELNLIIKININYIVF